MVARRVEVNRHGFSYQRACGGDVRFLAATLAHENFHLEEQSTDEDAADPVSRRVLRELGACRF